MIFFRFRHLRARQNQLGVIQRGKFPRELADGERVSGVEIGSADIGAAEVYNSVLLTEYRFLRLLGSCLIEGNALLERLKIKKQTFVDLVIPEGVTLTPRQGISCSLGKKGGSAALRILGAGMIEASGKNECAAIGGDSGEVNGPIEFHGPEVAAKGYNGGAGIGGGKSKMDADETTYISFLPERSSPTDKTAEQASAPVQTKYERRDLYRR